MRESRDVTGRVWGGQQHGRDELARAARVDHGHTAAEATARQPYGRAAALPQQLHLRSELLQCARQVVDGPLAHAWRAVDRDGTGGEGGERRDEASGGSRGTSVERFARRRQLARAARDRPDLGFALDLYAERRQARPHRFGVVARQSAHQATLAHRQGGDRQRSVREALGARDAHRRVQGTAGADRDGVAHPALLPAITLARISHQAATAATHLGALTGDLSLRVLDVATATSPLPSVEISCHHTHLRRLATRPW